MEPSAWLMGAVIMGGLGFYYWYSFGRHGGNMEGYQKHQFKLREGEKVLKYFHGHYHYVHNALDMLLEAAEVERGGKPLHFVITDQGRLVFRENAAGIADDPISLEKKQIKEVKVEEGNYGTIVGLTGKLEKKHLVEMHLADGNVIKVVVPISAVEVIKEWAQKI